MKGTHKDPEKIAWDPVMRSPPGSGSTRIFLKLMLPLILFVFGSYFVYTLKLVSAPRACHVDEPFHSLSTRPRLMEVLPVSPVTPRRTEIHDVVFGIAASAKLWEHRKEYIKLWYRPAEMRGAVWLDDAVEVSDSERPLLPPARISENTSRFPYSNTKGHRSAIRISRIVSETVRLGPTGARWLVMGDDDTVFIVENLLRVLRKYDHEQFYYIGSLSESHIQNIHFSYGMAYGGGGFAISYALAKALEKVQDRCIMRYPSLYGSDDRIQACMAELGVPLTKHVGFHQISN